MDINTYLKRINYRGSTTVTAQTLRDLQLAHLLTVPFENQSIHLGEPIVLEEGALFTKVVEQGRGGFCYELNGLFAALLRAMGFKVDMLSAGVAEDEGGYSPDFDHMTLKVSLEETWLVDVGFGDSFREPLQFDNPNVQVQSGGDYRIITDGDYRVLMERKPGEEWQNQYRFGIEPYQFDDYAERCRYHQTSPKSHFRKSRVCSRATPDGRMTLSDMRFITTKLNGERDERILADEKEYQRILREYFGISLRV